MCVFGYIVWEEPEWRVGTPIKAVSITVLCVKEYILLYWTVSVAVHYPKVTTEFFFEGCSQSDLCYWRKLLYVSCKDAHDINILEKKNLDHKALSASHGRCTESKKKKTIENGLQIISFHIPTRFTSSSL